MAYIFRERVTGSILPWFAARSIVIVDSDPEMNRLYARHFNDFGFSPAPFFDLEEAAEYVALQKPEAMLVEASLIVGNSVRLLKRLREEYPALVLVTIGAHAAEYDIDTLMALGASCHINRQFSSPKDVSVTVSELLGEGRAV